MFQLKLSFRREKKQKKWKSKNILALQADAVPCTEDVEVSSAGLASPAGSRSSCSRRSRSQLEAGVGAHRRREAPVFFFFSFADRPAKINRRRAATSSSAPSTQLLGISPRERSWGSLPYPRPHLLSPARPAGVFAVDTVDTVAQIHPELQFCRVPPTDIRNYKLLHKPSRIFLYVSPYSL